MHSLQRGYVISGSKEGSYPLPWLCLVFLRMRDRRIRNTGREINDVRPKFLIRWLRRLCFFLLESSTSVDHGVVLPCIRSDILCPSYSQMYPGCQRLFIFSARVFGLRRSAADEAPRHTRETISGTQGKSNVEDVFSWWNHPPALRVDSTSLHKKWRSLP